MARAKKPTMAEWTISTRPLPASCAIAGTRPSCDQLISRSHRSFISLFFFAIYLRTSDRKSVV